MTSARRPVLLAASLLLIALAVTAAGAATNDACTDSADIETDDFSAGVFLNTATVDPADPTNACVAGPPEHTVWYRWTASETARVIVHTCGTATDTTLAAFTGECDGLTPTGACSDDSVCGAGSILDFIAVKGQEYVFELGTHPGAMADFVAFQLCAFTPEADDKDEDLIPNCADPCTDSDKDGFGDPGFPFNVCPPVARHARPHDRGCRQRWAARGRPRRRAHHLDRRGACGGRRGAGDAGVKLNARDAATFLPGANRRNHRAIT